MTIFQTVVIAGHSAGAQMTQRYAALRRSTKNDDRLHFWIGKVGYPLLGNCLVEAGQLIPGRYAG